LCKELNAPAAAPHILAGVTTVLTLPSPVSSTNRDELTEDKKDKIPALIAAIYFFVCTRLSGKETTGREYASQRKGVLNTLMDLREDEELEEKIKKKAKEGDAWQGWEKIGTKDVDSWLTEISTRGWLKLDWFENIVEGIGLEVKNGTGDDVQDQDASQAEGFAADKNVLQTGLGTMMQDRVDYLSERQRAEYKIWKEAIMARIKQMEAEGADAAMDTSEG
jgi:origin recognition complex subunit 6